MGNMRTHAVRPLKHAQKQMNAYLTHLTILISSQYDHNYCFTATAKSYFIHNEIRTQIVHWKFQEPVLVLIQLGHSYGVISLETSLFLYITYQFNFFTFFNFML